MSAPPVVAPLTRRIDQARVEAYAHAARDWNPIHTDRAAAAAGPFGRPVAHGMLVLALVSDAMTAAFGERWAAGGTLKVRWRAPALQPVDVTAVVTLRRCEGGLATYDVSCQNAAGEQLLSGTATVPWDDSAP
jgi:3-hydroxybutyryl-CoA dehydratase